MRIDLSRLAGYSGVVIIQLAYYPLITRILRTGSVDGLSPWFFVVIALGVALLEVYSVAVRDWVYIISNIWALVNIGIVLMLIWFLGG